MFIVHIGIALYKCWEMLLSKAIPSQVDVIAFWHGIVGDHQGNIYFLIDDLQSLLAIAGFDHRQVLALSRLRT